MFEPFVIESIKEDAIARFPEESCGVVIARPTGEVEYLPMDNLAHDRQNSFEIDERVLIALGPRLLAVVHSHPNGPDCPSQRDMEQQLAWDVTFGIVSTDGVGCLEPFFWGDAVPVPPLIGRGFRHGVTDCYALVRDYFRVNLGVTLPAWAREWEWWNNGQRLYEDNFEKQGFFRIDQSEVREHDCFMAQIRSTTPNHAGIYVGGGLILHHLTSSQSADPSRVSRRDSVGSWLKFISGGWVRHESQVHA